MGEGGIAGLGGSGLYAGGEMTGMGLYGIGVGVGGEGGVGVGGTGPFSFTTPNPDDPSAKSAMYKQDGPAVAWSKMTARCSLTIRTSC